MRTVRLPIRIDLLGGWSDQLAWDGPAAVLNGAFGWEGRYPIMLHADGRVESSIPGIGTGLGISQALAAARLLQQDPRADYIAHAVEAERLTTQGGWQDAIGAVEPGFKLITTENGRDFRVERRDDHPILRHLVLFDTGIRRDSGAIGRRVRELIRTSNFFRGVLRWNVEAARTAFCGDAYTAARLALIGWGRLCSCVPEMRAECVEQALRNSIRLFPIWGYKLLGAGGGGYGVMFARHPEDRGQVICQLEAAGLWACIPELLPGVQIEGASLPVRQEFSTHFQPVNVG